MNEKITMIVGPNNSGKSKLLRCLGLIFNKGAYAQIDEADFSDKNDQEMRCKIQMKKHIINEKIPNARNLLKIIEEKSDHRFFEILLNFVKTGYQVKPTDITFKIIQHDYLKSHNFLGDFGQHSSDIGINLENIFRSINIEDEFCGTVYVPDIRFIATNGSSIPRFSQTQVPGETLLFDSVVQELQKIDRPSEQTEKAREYKEQICDFVKFCIDCKSIDFRVAHDASTIFVEINGDEQPISNLGVGIEQLLVIALGSFAFPDKLVLIDEPEIHFHPRTQKRMLQYLYDNSPAKFVLATHSASVLDAVEANVIRLETENAECRGRVVVNGSEKFRAIRDLGHTPSELIQANFVIWVEGPSDRIYINKWIGMMNSDLREGIDYSFVYYGGRVLAQHDFSDSQNDLMSVLPISRQFAVVMDSDKTDENCDINSTKKRVCEQMSEIGSFVWITEGREIENYIHKSLLRQNDVKGVNEAAGKFDKVIVDTGKVNKVKYAQELVKLEWPAEWPLDLEDKIRELTEAIDRAR